MNKCLVVNLFGAPGAGKSTGAAYIFSKLKLAGVNAELITEFAKDKVWEGNEEVFKADNQCYVFGEQFYRQSICKNKVDVIVTDSPLPLSIVYNKSEVLGESFNNVVMGCFNSFDNINFLILREKEYEPSGRLQTEEESEELLNKVQSLMSHYAIPCSVLKGNEDNYNLITEMILDKLNGDNIAERT